MFPSDADDEMALSRKRQVQRASDRVQLLDEARRWRGELGEGPRLRWGVVLVMFIVAALVMAIAVS